MAADPDRATVLDASVAVKLVIDEPYSDRALSLVTELRRGGVRVSVPPHFHSEVANAAYQQVRRQNVSLARAEAALASFLAMEFPVVFVPELPRAAFELAAQHGLASLYDAMYLALAVRLGANFWTDDQRLLRAIGDAFPNARWLGEYEST